MSEKREFSIKVTIDGVDEVLTGKGFILVVDQGENRNARIMSNKAIDTLELISACVACGSEQLLQNNMSLLDTTLHISNATSFGIKTAIDEFKGGTLLEQVATDAH